MTTADIFNVGAEFTGPDGTKYTLKKPTQYQQGEFQRWLEQRAHDAIDRGTEPADRKDRRHDRVYSDSAIGKYEWDGPLALEAMWTPAGLGKLLTIVCRDQGVTDEKVDAILAHSFKEVAAKIFMRASTDPKALREVLVGLGLPMDWMEFEPSEPSCDNSSTPPSTDRSPSSPSSQTTNLSSSTTSSEAPMG